MKALCIDGAISRMTIAAKNDDKIFTVIYDIGMKQSESIVPAIDYALEKVGLKASELDYTAIALGPGSFTGLRLSISAVKAIELAYNVPVYGIPTLNMYAYEFEGFEIPVLTAIDANKDRFYSSLSEGTKVLMEAGDWETEHIIKTVKKQKKIIICGPDRVKLKELIEAENKKINIFVPATANITTESLFALAEKDIENKKPGLKDIDGPVYLRASEAEIKLSEK